MYDSELVGEILRRILWSAETITKRCANIGSPEDFLISDDGLKTLDSICMQLIAIGESVKQLDKMTDGLLLERCPQVDWKRIMGMRDILSHHYFDLDAEVVYGVCTEHIEDLAAAAKAMLADLAE